MAVNVNHIQHYLPLKFFFFFCCHCVDLSEFYCTLQQGKLGALKLLRALKYYFPCVHVAELLIFFVWLVDLCFLCFLLWETCPPHSHRQDKSTKYSMDTHTLRMKIRLKLGHSVNHEIKTSLVHTHTHTHKCTGHMTVWSHSSFSLFILPFSLSSVVL